MAPKAAPPAVLPVWWPMMPPAIAPSAPPASAPLWVAGPGGAEQLESDSAKAADTMDKVMTFIGVGVERNMEPRGRKSSKIWQIEAC